MERTAVYSKGSRAGIICSRSRPLFCAAEGRVIEAVEVGEDRLHKPIEEQVGKTLHEIFSQEQAISSLLLGSQHSTSAHGRVQLADGGQTTWFSTRIAPIGLIRCMAGARHYPAPNRGSLQRSEVPQYLRKLTGRHLPNAPF